MTTAIAQRARIDGDTDQLLLEVADNGFGAEQGAIDRVFDAAQQNDTAQVGLTLTKAIVEQHGGQLQFRSTLNQGTHVQIRVSLH